MPWNSSNGAAWPHEPDVDANEAVGDALYDPSIGEIVTRCENTERAAVLLVRKATAGSGIPDSRPKEAVKAEEEAQADGMFKIVDELYAMACQSAQRLAAAQADLLRTDPAPPLPRATIAAELADARALRLFYKAARKELIPHLSATGFVARQQTADPAAITGCP